MLHSPHSCHPECRALGTSNGRTITIQDVGVIQDVGAIQVHCTILVPSNTCYPRRAIQDEPSKIPWRIRRREPSESFPDMLLVSKMPQMPPGPRLLVFLLLKTLLLLLANNVYAGQQNVSFSQLTSLIDSLKTKILQQALPPHAPDFPQVRIIHFLPLCQANIQHGASDLSCPSKTNCFVCFACTQGHHQALPPQWPALPNQKQHTFPPAFPQQVRIILSPSQQPFQHCTPHVHVQRLGSGRAHPLMTVVVSFLEYILRLSVFLPVCRDNGSRFRPR